MRVLENKNNMMILETSKNDYYLISYKSVIAHVNNIMVNNTYETETKLTVAWDYSQTTLKHLYNFLELYCTTRDPRDKNLIIYNLQNTNGKHAYIQDLIDRNVIKLVKETEI